MRIVLPSDRDERPELVSDRHCTECGRPLLAEEEELCADCVQEEGFSEDAWIEDNECD